MSWLFQTLIDFLQFFFNPLFNLISGFISYIWGYVQFAINFLLYLLTTFINCLMQGSAWIIDKALVYTMSGLQSIFGTTGIFSSLKQASVLQGYFSQMYNAGFVGITWIQKFIDVQQIVTPFTFYVGFLLAWTIYKLVKSWIPTIGN